MKENANTHYEISKHPIIKELATTYSLFNTIRSAVLEKDETMRRDMNELDVHLAESLLQVTQLMHAIVQQDARLFTGIVGYPVGMELADALMKRHEVIFDKHTQTPSCR